MTTNDYLNTGENIVCEARVSKIPLFIPLILTGIGTIAVIVSFVEKIIWLSIVGIPFAIVFLLVYKSLYNG